MSWIHRDDLVNLIAEALTKTGYSGIYNATAPKPVRMSELCSVLGERVQTCGVRLPWAGSWAPLPSTHTVTHTYTHARARALWVSVCIKKARRVAVRCLCAQCAASAVQIHLQRDVTQVRRVCVGSVQCSV